jgi:TonB-dependent receptor
MKTVAECCFVLTSNQAFHNATDTYQATAGANWTNGDFELSTEFDYTNSRYKRKGFIVDTALFVETEYDSNYQNSGTPFMGSNDLAYWLDSSNYHPTQLFDQWTRESSDEFDWKADATFTLSGPLKSIQAGVRYANRYAQNAQDWGGAISCYSGTDQNGPNPALVASPACNGGLWFFNDVNAILPGMMTKNHGPFFEGEAGWGVRNWMNAGGDWMFDHVSQLRTAFGQPTSDPAPILSNSFADRESSFAGYLMGNFDLSVADMPLTGNIGVRITDTLSKMDAYNTQVTPGNPPTYTPTQSSREDTDIMPSLNAKLQVEDNLFVRLGIGRTVTRPTFAQLNPGLYLSASGLTFNNNGSAGNPELHPVKSDNYDLGAEYYFGKADALTGTLFYRQIDGYIQSIIRTETYGGIDYAVTRPVNSGVGFLQGFEVAYTQWADFLPDFWSGLGIQLNGTFVEGRFTDITAVGGKHPYAGVSKWSFNVIPMYEYGPVTIRVSYNWRSSYQVGYTFTDTSSTNPAEVWTKPYGELGLSASYNITEQLVATFDANNLMDAKYQDTFGKGAFATIYPRDTRHYDQIYSLGLRYRM